MFGAPSTIEKVQIMENPLPKELPKVLFVDDDPIVTHFIQHAASKYNSIFTPITAKDGLEAVEILKKEPIQAIVTDLQMPNMDGTTLIEHLSKNHPNLPCAILTSGSNKSEIRFDRVHTYIQKPIDASTIFATVTDLLRAPKPLLGTITGMTLPNFLQIVESEKKTATVEIHTPQGERGYFFIKRGHLLDVKFKKKNGTDAALALLLENVDKIIAAPLPNPAPKKVIQESMMSLLMEALRQEDERNKDGDDSFMKMDIGNFRENLEQLSKVADPHMRMLLQPVAALRSSKDFLGLCIVDDFGHLWYSRSDASFLERESMQEFLQVVTFNSNKLENIDLGGTDEIVWTTEKAVLLIRQSPILGNIRFKVLLAISAGPNQNMLRTKLKHILNVTLPEIIRSQSFLDSM